MVQKRTWSSVGRPWARKCARVCFGRFPGGSPHPKLHICLRLGSHPSSLWRCALPQKVDFAGRLFAIHFLGVFRADFGASAPVKMWFWYRRGYENLLFQIANILAIEGSIFNVFREPNLAKTRKGHPLMSSSKSKRKSESIFSFASFLEKIVIRAPPLWSLKNS